MDNRKHGEHDHGGHRQGMQGHDDRHGARQPERFDPARAALLDNPARFEHLPPDEVFAMLAAPAKSRVVDFGTGTGMYAIELALHDWAVFPLRGKVPAIPNPHPRGSMERQHCKGECGLHGHGVHDATRRHRSDHGLVVRPVRGLQRRGARAEQHVRRRR